MGGQLLLPRGLWLSYKMIIILMGHHRWVGGCAAHFCRLNTPSSVSRLKLCVALRWSAAPLVRTLDMHPHCFCCHCCRHQCCRRPCCCCCR